MIFLDTNVLSELVRATPNERVLRWPDDPSAERVATTAVRAAELRYGVARLSDGRRRVALEHAVHSMLDDDLRDRVEPFDLRAAVEYAALVADRDRLGRPIGVADAQITAICRAHGAVLATGNRKDFQDTGLGVIDPWRPA